ncbi:MAG: beta-lactamase family protein [Erythrobacteraceae bacterium]|jgi:CubicO group peptidase (beta-lactamase class C family)|nr:beta-lactamase family protein [Erythrobacteraceae bacterium]
MRRVFRILVIVSAFASYPAVAQDKTDHELDDLSDDITFMATKYGAPGVSVSVIADDKIIYTYTMGHADLETARPVEHETQFGIGSVVKSFTSALIGQLASEGKLDLDASPAEYVPGLEFGDAGLSRDLTIRNLLSQTSGLPNIDGSTTFFPPETQAELAPRLVNFPASCRVGDCWAYNNLNFIMLDMVAESVTGQSKTTLITERLFAPIGMAGSLSATEQFMASRNAAVGYVSRSGKMERTAVERLFGEHAYATAPDMARWLGMWMSDGQTAEAKIVPTDYAKQALSMQAIENGSVPDADEPNIYLFGYGYGWQIKSVEGNYAVHHGGNENGFSTHVMMVPAKNIGIVVLTNQQDSVLPYVVTDMIMRKMLGLTAGELSQYPVIVRDAGPLAEPGAELQLDESDPLALKTASLSGTYEAAGYGQIHVHYEDKRLVLTTPGDEFSLKHLGGSRFGLTASQPPTAGIEVDYFEVDFGPDSGTPQSLTFNIAAAPVVFKRAG